MNALVGALLGAAVKGGILAAIVRVFEDGRSAATRHLLWTGVVAAHVALLVGSPALPSWRLPGFAVPERAVPVLEVLDMAADREDPAADVASLPLPGEGRSLSPGLRESNVATVGSGASSDAAPSRRSAPAFLLWVVVAFVLLMRSAGRVRRGALAGMRATPCPDPGWRRAVSCACGKLSVRRPVEIRTLAGAAVPMLTEVPKPILILPESARSWPPERRRAVALHEVAHLHRRDQIWRIFGQLSRAVLWFAPGVWYAVHRMEAEAEAACDELVVAEGVRPDRYVRELLGALRELRPGPQGAASALGRRRGLEHRVRRVLSLKPGQRGGLTATGITLVSATVVLGVIGLGGFRVGATNPPGTGHVGEALATNGGPNAGRTPAGSVCPYEGGTRRERYVDAGEDHGLVWSVVWEGRACRVEFEARPAGAVDPGLLPRRGLVRIEVAGPDGDRRLTLRREAPDAPLEIRQNGAPVDREERRDLLAWYRRAADEIAGHTGYDARTRVPDLLERGGVPAVFSHVEAMPPGHGAGAYLRTLVDLHPLEARQVRSTLVLAAARVQNDASLSELLAAVAKRYSVADEPIRGGFLEAVSALHADAASDEALTSLSGTGP